MDAGRPDPGRNAGLGMLASANCGPEMTLAVQSAGEQDIRQLTWLPTASPGDRGWGLMALTVRGSVLSLAAFHAGVPLGPLAEVAVYGSDLRGRRAGKSHAPEPYCQHARGPLCADDDRVLLADLLPILAADAQQVHRAETASRFCLVCGGFAIRRLTSEQQHYYRSVGDLADQLRAVVDGEQLLADKELRSGPWAAASIAYVVAKLDQVPAITSALAEAPYVRGFANELAERADVARRRLAMLRR